MTEYWKSQARKYCEFCKCWLADNKVSASFHENGKRHKENVQRHISQLTKRSAKEFKQKEKLDDDIKKMEQAAMAAYLKDVQNNADLTSQSINEMIGGESCSKSNPPVSTAAPPAKPPVWQEVKNDGGNYYWNMETNETTWEAPDEYLSLAQQEKEELKKKEKERAKEKLKKEKQKECLKEVNAHLAREKMRELAVKKEDDKPAAVSYGPSTRPADPFGAWTPVVNQPQEKVDLQLPKVEIVAPPVIVEPETVKFKEKTVDSLGEGPVDFKKRKLNNKFKRNIRQKTDDD